MKQQREGGRDTHTQTDRERQTDRGREKALLEERGLRNYGGSAKEGKEECLHSSQALNTPLPPPPPDI